MWGNAIWMEKILKSVFSSMANLHLRAEREFLHVEVCEERTRHSPFHTAQRPNGRLAPVRRAHWL